MNAPALNAEGASSITRLHAVVHGRVQGVGFRYWVHHTAGTFGGAVTGSVHNQHDDMVVVEAESPSRAHLELLLKELHHGPSSAHVELVDAIWEEDVAPRYKEGFAVA